MIPKITIASQDTKQLITLIIRITKNGVVQITTITPKLI